MMEQHKRTPKDVEEGEHEGVVIEEVAQREGHVELCALASFEAQGVLRC